jgi:hypothetical protein
MEYKEKCLESKILTTGNKTTDNGTKLLSDCCEDVISRLITVINTCPAVEKIEITYNCAKIYTTDEKILVEFKSRTKGEIL